MSRFYVEIREMKNGRWRAYRAGRDGHGLHFDVRIEGQPSEGFGTETEVIKFVRGKYPRKPFRRLLFITEG